MNRLARYSLSAVALAVAIPAAMAGAGVAGAQVAVPAHPTSATKWTQISTYTHLGLVTPGLFRTGDGRLHVIWPRQISAGAKPARFTVKVT